jgi:nucleoside 2-deoxyribosyltransferase
VVIAILDGPDVDAGTCVEIGYAYANNKSIVGIRTDFRASEDRGVNLMVSKVCTHLILLQDNTVTLDNVLNEVVRTVKSLST